MSEILLSICIPTYNRAEYLENTINSIISQKRFQETTDIEIVISDNCSDDNTSEISYKYVKLYGEKIHYYRNKENIQDANYEKALSYGRGSFLKLNNDTLIYISGSLDRILDTIQANKKSKRIIFFSNGVLKTNKNLILNGLDLFLNNVSYYSGWIGGFGIWKEDFDLIEGFSRNSKLQLTQVDVLFRLINKKKTVFLNNDKLFETIPVSKKGGYDLLTVFMENYFKLLEEQTRNKSLSLKIFQLEKRRVLIQFLRPWLVGTMVNPEKYSFKYNNWFKRILNCYKREPLTFLYFLLYFSISLCFNFLKKEWSLFYRSMREG